MAIFVAVDAGGSKTQCWVADEKRVLASGSCGTVKLMSVGEETATERLHGLLRTTADEAGVELREATRVCMGLAGTSIASVRRWSEAALGAVVGGDVVVCGDEEIALEAAFAGGAGILVVAGTGSNVVGRCADGTRVSAGGWGPVIGDEGGGHWIGREAVRAALRARDAGQATGLLEAVQAFWGLGSLHELVEKANARERVNFAELAGVVAGCAVVGCATDRSTADGDAVAAGVLARAGEELAAQVEMVAAKMLASGCGRGDVARVAFTGSVVEKIAAVRESMAWRLRSVRPEMVVDAEAAVALEGALWMARRG